MSATSFAPGRSGLGIRLADGDFGGPADVNQVADGLGAARDVVGSILGGVGVYAGAAAELADLPSGTGYPACTLVLADDTGRLWPFRVTAPTAITFSATSGACKLWASPRLMAGVSPAAATGATGDVVFTAKLASGPDMAHGLLLGSGTVAGSAFTDFTPADTAPAAPSIGSTLPAGGTTHQVLRLDADGNPEWHTETASDVGALDATLGPVVYQGVWNASTNSPALASGVGTKGFAYRVSVAGTTDIDGTAQWDVNDSIVFDGTRWDRLEGSVAPHADSHHTGGSDALAPSDIGAEVAGTAASLLAAQTLGEHADSDITPTVAASSPQALVLDGTHYAELEATDTVQGHQYFSSTLWFKPTADPAGLAGLLGCLNGTSAGGWGITRDVGTNTYRFKVTTGALWYGAAFTLTDSAWHCIIVQKEPNGGVDALRVYLDGTQVSTYDVAAVNVGAASYSLRVGAMAGQLGVIGDVQDVCLLIGSYLTPTQLAAHYAAGVGVVAVEGAPWTKVWHFDGSLDHSATWQGGGSPSYTTGHLSIPGTAPANGTLVRRVADAWVDQQPTVVPVPDRVVVTDPTTGKVPLELLPAGTGSAGLIPPAHDLLDPAVHSGVGGVYRASTMSTKPPYPRIDRSFEVPTAAQPLSYGLLADWLITEPSGTTLQDLVSGRELAITGGAAAGGSPGLTSPYVTFDGSDDIAVVADAAFAALPLDQPWSARFTFATTATPMSFMPFLGRAASSGKGWAVGLASGGVLAVQVSDGTNTALVSYASATVVNTGAMWQGIATYNGGGIAAGNFAVYVWGITDPIIVSGTAPTSDIVPTGELFTIGGAAGVYGSVTLSHVTLWTRALEAVEATYLYTSADPQFLLEGATAITEGAALTMQSGLIQPGPVPVPTSRTVNGHALTGDISVTAGDVGFGTGDSPTLTGLTLTNGHRGFVRDSKYGPPTSGTFPAGAEFYDKGGARWYSAAGGSSAAWVQESPAIIATWSDLTTAGNWNGGALLAGYRARDLALPDPQWTYDATFGWLGQVDLITSTPDASRSLITTGFDSGGAQGLNGDYKYLLHNFSVRSFNSGSNLVGFDGSHTTTLYFCLTPFTGAEVTWPASGSRIVVNSNTPQRWVAADPVDTSGVFDPLLYVLAFFRRTVTSPAPTTGLYSASIFGYRIHR